MNFYQLLRPTAKMGIIFTLTMSAILLYLTPAAYAHEGVTVSIPALNINSGIARFPLNGISWTIRPWEQGIGHLEGTGWFSDGGNIALAGHSVMPDSTPGIFSQLHLMNVGDEIVVEAGDGQRSYTVTSIGNIPINDLTVLYPTGGERLTLVTCDANSFDSQSQSYLRRVIVVAERTA